MVSYGWWDERNNRFGSEVCIMTSIRTNKFGGVSPKISARYLGENQAQTAQNCVTWKGPLTPLDDVSTTVLALEKSDIQSIYRFGKDVDSETQYWFTKTTVAEFVQGAIAGDTTEKTFFTGDGVPKATDNTLALTGGGTDYPIASYTLGVPAPTTAPICAVSGVADAGAVSATRIYTYVYVNSWGWPSAPYAADPMPSSTEVTVATGQTVTITLPTPPTGNFDLDYTRIYCSAAGSDTDSLLFVAEIAVATTEYEHDFDADGLGEECPSVTWAEPPDDLEGLIGLPNGGLAGFDGIDLYFCEPYRPYAWPTGYIQSLGNEIVGLGNIDTTVVALTVGKPYFIQGSHPDSMVSVEAEIEQACVSKRSIVSMLGRVFYASPDGLMAIAPGVSENITFDLFDKEQWQTIVPSSIHAYSFDGKYIAFYDDGETQGGFIFDPAEKEFIFHEVYADAGYTDLLNDTLYLSIDDNLVKWEGGSALDYIWKSKQFTFPSKLTFSRLRVSAESYPVTFKLYCDETLIYSKSIKNDSVYTLPSKRGRLWEYQLEGSVDVFEVVIAQSAGEIGYGQG